MGPVLRRLRRTGTGIAIFHRFHEGAAVASYEGENRPRERAQRYLVELRQDVPYIPSMIGADMALLVSLRNAVGMMSEARRADAAEYHDMRELNREMRADALRLRWLADDHADSEVRDRVRSICQSLPTRSISGARLDIDAAMRP